MSEVLFNDAIDAKLAQIEDLFSQSLEKVLSEVLAKSCSVAREGPFGFDFPTIKGLFPDQAIVMSVHLTEESTGELKFLLEPTVAAFLADLARKGDGTAAFSAKEHLDTIQEMISQTLDVYATALSAQFERKIVFGEVRAVLLDISPADFAENNWVWSRHKIDLDGDRLLVKLVSHAMVHGLAEEKAAIEGEEADSTRSATMEADDPDRVLRDMALLLDIELPITIELGRTSLLIREILSLGPGAIVELDKLSGEPVDVLVNDKKFAQGEVVVIDENFAVRLTEILRPDERLKALKD
jgi:flagellar motor switch protein FliN/FliY